MTDDTTQAAAATLLSTGAFVVDTRSCDRGSFLVVECDPTTALTVYELVMMADHDAELIHSTRGPSHERHVDAVPG